MLIPGETVENVVLVLIGLAVGAVGIAALTSYDAQAIYFASDPVDYVTSSDQKVELRFEQGDVEFLNRVSSRSLGLDPVADERLLCFQVRGGNVTKLYLVDKINVSAEDKISGKCVYERENPVDGMIHTHPSHSGRLSKEDRDVETGTLDFTCIQYGEITEDFVGDVQGLNCWKIVGDKPRFEEVGLEIVQSLPEQT